MSMKNRLIAPAALALALLPAWVSAQGQSGLNLKWGPDYRTVAFTFQGKPCDYPARVEQGDFPEPGAAPVITIEQAWPVVTMRARWTLSTEALPEKYRPDVLDLILLFGCDVELYEQTYPEAIVSSRLISLPKRSGDAPPPTLHGLAERLRGQTLDYEVEAAAGTGASNYTITTGIRFGVSKDGKTVFYYDKPGHISEHLQTREYVFAAHNKGNRVQFELLSYCVCTPRLLLKDAAMGRVADYSCYLVKQMQATMARPRTAEEIEQYLKSVKARYRPDETEQKAAGTQTPPDAKGAGK